MFFRMKNLKPFSRDTAIDIKFHRYGFKYLMSWKTKDQNNVYYTCYQYDDIFDSPQAYKNLYGCYIALLFFFDNGTWMAPSHPQICKV